MMNNDALAAILRGQGYRVWWVGASARAAVTGAVAHRQERATDAPTEALDAALAVVRGLDPAAGPWSVSAVPEGIDAWLRTRGFTVDAFAVDGDGERVDPLGGVAHLAAGVLRTVDSPDRAFREDPLRLLELPRLVSETGAWPVGDVRRFAARDAGNILDTRDRRQRWGEELNGLLLGAHVERALQAAWETRVIPFLMPEVAGLVGFDKSCAVHHKDIWEHTKLVTQKAEARLVVRWAALCHDIGKVWTRSVNREGKVHFFRHEEHGALLFESIAHRVGLDAELTERVAYVIETHSRVNLYQDDWTDSAVRRLIRETQGHLPDLIAFSKADFTTKREATIQRLERQMRELEARIAQIEAEDARLPPLSKGIGDAIMSHYSLAPSRTVGRLKRLLEDTIASGELPERGQDRLYLDWLDQREEVRDWVSEARAR